MLKKIFLVASCLLSTNIVHAGDHPVVAQYFGIWGQWEQKFRTDTPFDKLTRLYIAFGKVSRNEDGHFTLRIEGNEDRLKALVERTRAVNPNAEIFISVGGNGDYNSFGGAADDLEFATNVKTFLQKYQLNGLDIDWELDLDRVKLNSLVKNLYPSLHAEGYLLTLAVWPRVEASYDMPVLSANLDQINLMSYGTGLNLPQLTTWFGMYGFPKEKIIGGIETESGYHQFKGFTDTLGDEGTIAQKAKYAMQNGLAGMMSWRLDNDYAEKDNPNYSTYRGALALWQYMHQAPEKN